MKKRIEEEFKLWIAKYSVTGNICISADQIENEDGSLFWSVDLYKESGGKDFFNYLGNGNFEFAGDKC